MHFIEAEYTTPKLKLQHIIYMTKLHSGAAQTAATKIWSCLYEKLLYMYKCGSYKCGMHR